MKGIVALFLLAALAGCSAKQVKPEATASQMFRTPIEGATAQLVLSQEFQRAVITQKPSWGQAWKPWNFEVPVGEPMSKALAYDTKSRIPAARVGNVDDGKAASVRIDPTSIAIEFGVDDGSAIAWTALSPLGLGSDIVVSSKLKLTATLAFDGQAPRPVTVEGHGVLPMAYFSLRERHVGQAIGLAIDDAALKLGDLVEAELRKR